MKLCREYDSSMSQKMMISWLENGIKDSLKIQIKRQMKLLSETARTTQAFLKIAKDEQELQDENRPESEPTPTYTPYFANTVSTTLLQQNEDTRSNNLNQPSSFRTTAPHESRITHQQRSIFTDPQRPLPQTRQSSSQQRSSTFKPQSSTSYRNTQQIKPQNVKSADSWNIKTRQRNPCSICQRNNHRTIDCYFKKPDGCYKCGQSDHRIRDCPEVFC